MDLKKLEELSDSLESILSDLTAALGTSQAAEIRELLNSRRWGTADDLRLFLDILDNNKQNPPPNPPQEPEQGKRGIFQVANLIKKQS